MKVICTFFLVLFVSQVNSQSLAINTDGSTANASALLDVKSTAKGILIPRMSSVERTGIAAPASGLLVYDMDSLAFSFYNGTVWTFLKADADTSKGWSLKGNIDTDTAINFLGTKDNMPLRFKLNNNWAGQWDAAKSNFFIGTGAGTQITTGINNIGIGDSSLSNNTFRSGLTAVGHNSLTQNTNGSGNTAMGFSTLYANSVGYQNTAVGYSALTSNTSGYRNTAIGNDAMSFAVSGHSNVAIGADALSKTTGSWNIGIGNTALLNNTTGVDNISIGQSSLRNNTKGSYNVAIGSSALINDTTGYSNVGVGSGALASVRNQSNLVAIGDSSLLNNGLGAALATQAIQNTATGSKALYSNTLGSSNTANGYRALYSNTVATSNTAVGYFTLGANTTGNSNTAMGAGALIANITGSNNVAVGVNSLALHKQQGNNTAVGYAAMQADTSGFFNSAFGYASLSNNKNGNFNTAIGYNTLGANVTGTYNTAIGYRSEVLADGLTNANAIGSYSAVSSSNSLILGSINGINTATADTKVGIGVTNPSEKLEIGNGRLRFRGYPGAGSAHGITWTNNAGTIDRAFIGMENDDLIGVYNFGFGAWNFRINNSSGEVGINKQPLLTNNDSRLQVKQTGVQNGIGIESSANTNHWDWFVTNAANSDLQLYYNGALKGTYGNAGGVYTPSDRRLKKDVFFLSSSINQINKLEAYKYRYLDNNDTDAYSYGFMAQDVEKLFPDAVRETEIKNGEKRMGINYQYFTVLAIKGIQEQQLIIDNQNKKIENLQMQIDEIKKMIKKD